MIPTMSPTSTLPKEARKRSSYVGASRYSAKRWSSLKIFLFVSVIANIVLIVMMQRLSQSMIVEIKKRSQYQNKEIFLVGTEQQKDDKETKNGLDFYSIAIEADTDKVLGKRDLPRCLDNEKSCHFPRAKNPRCRVWGHFYDTLYQRWLSPLSGPDVEPFQFLEIGFYEGNGYDAFGE
mmetsp:Transcript_34846/g.42604  ORF Transcript_34846/g.42604 Transcript_34846/m.42604 type:complete len:178 (-) Transcript_34846:202-735(-)